MAFNWQSVQRVWRSAQAWEQKQPLPHPSLNTLSFASAVEKAFPSVVSINAYHSGLRDNAALRPNQKILDLGVGIGSGVIISEQGYIVTNYHVIEGADNISINLADGRKRLVQVVGFDAKTDIAVLKTDLDNLQAAQITDSESLKTGDIVMAIGSPFGREQSVSLGIISALSYNSFSPQIQTDAAINSGNSGGALVNALGQLIGINQMTLSSKGGGQTGVNYAIPISRVMRIIDDLITHGRVRRNWLGISAGEYSGPYRQAQEFPETEYGTGFFVAEVDPNSPAHIAGLQRFDFITEYEGKPLTGVVTFYRLFYETPVGKTVTVKAIRQGKVIEVRIDLVEQP